MNDLLDLIYDFRKYVEFQIVSSDYPPYKEMKRNIISSLSSLSKIKQSDVDTMIHALYKVYDTLTGQYAKLYLPKTEIADYHKYVYSFFAKGCGISSPAKYFQYLPTKIFEEFVKGITFFKADEETLLSNPLYHRIQSCGSKDVESTSKFIHNKGDTKEVRAMKTKALRKCIIERQIYDQIYTKVLHYQDVGHKHELQSLQDLYLDLAATTIRVEVHFKHNSKPFHVMVRTYRRDSLIDIESYDKRSNGSVVVEKYKDKPVYKVHSPPIKYQRRLLTQTYDTKTSSMSPNHANTV